MNTTNQTADFARTRLTVRLFVYYSMFAGFGFNGGSAISLGNAEDTSVVGAYAVVNSTLAAAMGGVATLLMDMYKSSHNGEVSFDLTKTVNGSLAGLVAITAPCGVVEPWAAVLIGGVAGLIYLWGSSLLLKLRLDDAVDGIPVHLCGGIWGLFATGLFASPSRLMEAYGHDQRPGFLYSLTRGVDGVLLGNQCLEIIFILVWCFVTMTPFFFALNHLSLFRVDELEEIAGLDVSYNHAIQEDHDKLRKQVVKEYKRIQNRRNEGSVAGSNNDPSTVGITTIQSKSNGTKLDNVL